MNEVSRPRRYLLVSPCRDEAEHLQVTIDAVAAQTVLPAKWLIVDDGSTDETPSILAAAAAKYPFIEVVRRPDRGGRSVGPGVIDAVYHGLSLVDLDEYEYVCKFDCDLELGPRYFARTMEHFESDPWLGTLSGKLYLRSEDGGEAEERTGDENSVGPVKFYRVSCFRDIGGFVREVCWDGIDGHMCRMEGWIARALHDPEMRIVHRRQVGSSHVSLWHGRMRWGRGKHFMGSRLYYAAAVSLYRMLERPYLIGGLGILSGYLQASLRGQRRMTDQGYLRALRRFELESLLFGKRRTVERYDRRIRQAVHRGILSRPGVPRRLPAERGPETVRILNATVGNTSFADLLDRFRAGLAVFLNVDCLMKLQKDADYAAICRNAEYVIADGQIVVGASRFLGTPIREKVSGSDFLGAFCAFHRHDPDVKVFLLGSGPGIAERARARINARIGREIVVAAHSPSYGFENDPAECAGIVDRINDSGATVLVVGVGAPKQEKWIARHRHQLRGVTMFLAVGATIDFEAGAVRRSPAWISRAGLEWLFRLCLEPRRLWRRYLVEGPPFFWLLLKQRAGRYEDPLTR